MLKPPHQLDHALNHKAAFLNSVFLLTGVVAFAMSFYHARESLTMGALDLVFAAANFSLVYYLNRHQDKVNIVSSIALALSYLLFTAIYLLASYNTTRISLFLLLSASAFYLKGRKIGFIWLLVMLLTIGIGQIGFHTGYSAVDILTFDLYLLALFFVIRNYEIFNEKFHERLRAEEVLRLSAKVFENIREGIMITDVSGNIVEVNEAFCRTSGYAREELVGKNPRLLQSGLQNSAFYRSMWEAIASTGHFTGEVWNRKKDDELYAEWLSISAINDENGRVSHYVGISSDITLLKQHERQLERIAHYDALTGIPNRSLLSERMKEAIARTTKEMNMMAVCYLDLDGFKPINDSMGHEAGDQVLIEIAQRIQDTIRAGDTVARLGGDEFVILLLGQERGEECSLTLERLLAAIGDSITIMGKTFELSASIGVSIYPLDEEDPDTLLRHADQAMYVAKQSGKNRFHIYDPAMDQRTRDQHELLKNIQFALKHNQFELYYQPKINLRSRLLTGVEALIRWNHPQMGLLLPAKFLPPVENTALDIEIGEWVIAAALQQLDCWRDKGLDIEMSINISANHLESPNFVEALRRQLMRYPQLAANRLQIEVLETVALEDIGRVTRIIEACRNLGVGFALDDFGTGYSSLSYLSHLPVDTLKIDQSFMRNLDSSKGDHAIVLGIIALSRAFEMQTVAEGMETIEHFNTLLDMGCEIGQGFGIARPMAAGALLEWAMDNRNGKRLFSDMAIDSRKQKEKT